MNAPVQSRGVSYSHISVAAGIVPDRSPAQEATVAGSKVLKLLGACALCLALVAGVVLLIKRLL
jgi:hypothetical protein